MNLNTDTWAEYRLGDLFDIRKGKRLTTEDQIPGGTPYIGAIDSNNGVANYIGQEPIHSGNTISLSYNGSVGEAFYQPVSFWATDDVNVLYFRDKEINFNKYIAMFICTILKQEKYRYCYGRKWILNSMNETVIKLPTKDNKPDWSFMENYIKTLHYNTIATKNKFESKLKLDQCTLKPFVFGKLVKDDDIYKAKSYSKVELEISKIKLNGYIPFVSRTEENNSVDCYVSGNEFTDIEDGNAITIGDTTSTIAYQANPFVNGDHIIVIHADWLNKYTGMFMVSLLKKERFRYSYGRAFLMDSIKNTRVFLPILCNNSEPIIDSSHQFSDDGFVPDWSWIERYIKSFPYSDRI